MCRAELPRKDVARTGEQREPYRYKYRFAPVPRDAAFADTNMDPFSNPSTVNPLYVEKVDPFCINGDFAEVPVYFLDVSCWQGFCCSYGL